MSDPIQVVQCWEGGGHGKGANNVKDAGSAHAEVGRSNQDRVVICTCMIL